MGSGTIMKVGSVLVVESTPTIDTNIYTSGDLVGTKISLTPAVRAIELPSIIKGTGTIVSVIITDLGKQDATIDVVFFDTDPSNTTFTNNTALTINDTDLLNIIGLATIDTWKDFVNNSVGITSAAIAFPLVLQETTTPTTPDTTLYAAMVTRGTPTYASTTDLTLRVGILVD